MTISLEKRILAIDFGLKRIGLAISDPLLIFPSITLTLSNNSNTLAELVKIISEKNIKEIVLGIPGVKNESTENLVKEIAAFKLELEKRVRFPIHLWDEQFTSKIASARIHESVSKKSKRRNKEIIDSEAAAVILEEYLRTLNRK